MAFSIFVLYSFFGHLQLNDLPVIHNNRSRPSPIGDDILKALIANTHSVPNIPSHRPPRVPLVGVLLDIASAKLLHLHDGQGLNFLPCLAEVVERYFVRDGHPLGVLGDATPLRDLSTQACFTFSLSIASSPPGVDMMRSWMLVTD
ncbi:hypothetical protein EYF80_002026 [Liparis tanakae]|uniref:Uncharacterized protein n=1 Tax=Liparis tanakae TaxID=230148 RepID=A0A4Z2JBS4_9TELE|nr:hypothetical protein EYF80_002026 [Liparis tanakae]